MKTYTLKSPRRPRTKQERLAVRVAKDVVLQLRVGQYTATPGEYLSPHGGGPYATPSEKCRVCALGAAWLSFMRLQCDGDVFNIPSSSGMAMEMEPAMNGFARLMEAAFEGTVSAHHDYPAGISLDNVQVAALAWWAKFRNADVRMRRIMNNIVRNGGVFKIEEVQ